MPSRKFLPFLLYSVTLQICFGSVTITTKSSADGATTLPRMTFSGYVGHVTVFS